VRTAAAADSRQIPARWLEIVAASRTPATIPSTVLIARSPAKSATGSAIDPPPLISAPASASAKTAPVGSLKADSATTVCATFGRSRERTNSGISIAGSVGERIAPMSSAAVQERPKAKCAIAPVIAAVRITPGTTSMPRLIWV
jgi:hypothetical protein